MPRAAAQGGDLTGADRLAIGRVLGIAQALDTTRCLPVTRRTLPARADAGAVDAQRPPRPCWPTRRRRAPRVSRPVCRSAARGLGRRSVPGRPALVAESRV